MGVTAWACTLEAAKAASYCWALPKTLKIVLGSIFSTAPLTRRGAVERGEKLDKLWFYSGKFNFSMILSK